MEVKVLGTVSPYCKNNKNCPGFLVQGDEKNILLDCGSGVLRYLELEKIINKMEVIISHLHKDHYGDLLSLGYASYVYHNLGLLDERIKVYVPKGSDNIGDYAFLKNFGEEHYLEFIYYDMKTELNIGEFRVDFATGVHQIPSYAIGVRNKDARLVYSGDTGYKGNSLEWFAKEADLLIIETTFLNKQEKRYDYHLKTLEAALIAKEARVKKLMLTHFWPEISPDVYLREVQEIFLNSIVVEEGKSLILKKS